MPEVLDALRQLGAVVMGAAICGAVVLGAVFFTLFARRTS